MAIRVLSPGTLTSVQDLGRRGYERFGVPQSGAMDAFALRAANLLVGNPPGAAGLEFTLEPPVLQMEEDCLVAAAGCGYALSIHGRHVGMWRAVVVWRGEVVRVIPDGAPGWGYLAVQGGIAVPQVMGSRSTYLRGGFGGWQGRALRAEDVLPMLEKRPRGWQCLAGRYLPAAYRPAYASQVTVPVVPGPQSGAFTDQAMQVFFQSEYSVSAVSDRMGYRLSGPRLEHSRGADLLSEPMPWGAVQVPADGQPMVMMADRPTTGGYPKIATVARAGLPLLAQAMPGSGHVRFASVSVEEAQARYREMLAMIETGLDSGEGEEWYGFEL